MGWLLFLNAGSPQLLALVTNAVDCDLSHIACNCSFPCKRKGAISLRAVSQTKLVVRELAVRGAGSPRPRMRAREREQRRADISLPFCSLFSFCLNANTWRTKRKHCHNPNSNVPRCWVFQRSSGSGSIESSFEFKHGKLIKHARTSLLRKKDSASSVRCATAI